MSDQSAINSTVTATEPASTAVGGGAPATPFEQLDLVDQVKALNARVLLLETKPAAIVTDQHTTALSRLLRAVFGETLEG